MRAPGLRKHWREPAFWRWWWRVCVPLDVKVVLAVGLAGLLGAAGYVAAQVPAGPVAAGGGGDPAVVTVRTVVTVREPARTVRRVVVRTRPGPGRTLTRTALLLRTVALPVTRRVVTTVTVDRPVRVLERRVTTAPGETRTATVTTTAPGPARTVTTVETAVATVTVAEPAAPVVRTVAFRPPPPVVVRTVRTVTIPQPTTVLQPTTLERTVTETTTVAATVSRTVTVTTTLPAPTTPRTSSSVPTTTTTKP